MAKNFLQSGDVLDVPAPYDVISGGGLKIGGLFGVAQTNAKSGDPVTIIPQGVWRLPKTSGQAWTIGAPIYWDDTAKVTTSTASTNLPIGHAFEIAANPSAYGVVRLSI